MNASNDRTTNIAMSGKRTDSKTTTLLLVDDSKADRHAAREFLAQAGYTVVTAVDGFDALAKVVEYQPALVFVDIMMPRLDGYQTCALIKNNAKYRHIPVLILTSQEGLLDKARARVVRSDACLSKPLTKATLIGAVKKHAEQRRLPSETVKVPSQSFETSDA